MTIVFPTCRMPFIIDLSSAIPLLLSTSHLANLIMIYYFFNVVK